MAGGLSNPTVTPPSGPDSVSQWLIGQVDSVLQSAIATPVEHLTAALLPVITIGLSLQFIAYAFAIMHGQGSMNMTEFFRKAIMVAIISMFATAGGLYQTDISQMMLSLPDGLSYVVTGSNSVSSDVDKLQQEANAAIAALEGPDGSSSWPSMRQITLSIVSAMVTGQAAMVSAAITVIMVVVKVGMALVVATGPIFIAALLFEPTKKLFDSWVSQALNFVILGALAGLMLGILLEMNLSFLRSMAIWVAGGESNLWASLGSMILVGLASIVILIMLPGLAAGLSGGFGAQMGVGSASRGAFTALRLKSMMRKPKLPGGGGAKP